jgi:hypothetical protein
VVVEDVIGEDLPDEFTPAGDVTLFDLPVIIVVDLRDGLMAKERLYWDRGRLEDQLGVPATVPVVAG